MSKEKYICSCCKVTEDDIRKAVKKGASSPKEVRQETKAAEKCGHCKSKVKEVTKKYLEDRKKKDKTDIKKSDKKSKKK